MLDIGWIMNPHITQWGISKHTMGFLKSEDIYERMSHKWEALIIQYWGYNVLIVRHHAFQKEIAHYF